jgi:predicted dehydrogenase
MSNQVNLAVIGLGRIGEFHALHAKEVAAETEGCTLTALVDSDLDKARGIATELGEGVAWYPSIEHLIGDGTANAAICSTPTDDHHEHATQLIEAGYRVLLEKPMTDSLASDREFVRKLNETAPNALMLAFQRRYDAPLQKTRRIVESGAIGRPFKIVSVLEDSNPAPAGFNSPGMLYDMAVHNADEIMWLLGGRYPERAIHIGNRIYSQSVANIEEDYDDGFIQLWFDGDLTGQIIVSRNHVPGYRIETWIFGEKGFVHSGHFDQKTWEITVEAYGRSDTIAHEVFPMRNYGRKVPEFVDRFGPAYVEEIRDFVTRCQNGEPFTVNQNDGLRAMEVIAAAYKGAVTREQAAKVEPVS